VPYVVDCGYGTSRRLLDAGVPLNRVRYIFITHHHSDHNLEYGSVIYNAWVTGLPMQVDAYGPPGLEQMTNAFFEYQKFDIDTRISDEGRPDLRTLVTAHEYSGAGVVLQNEAVAVTAARVRHPPITHAYALRFDTKDRSIVMSGDTAYSPELVALARGADILVHEIMSLAGIELLLKRVPNAARLREHLLASHTLPDEVGKAAAQAGVKTLVLTHFVPHDAGLAEGDWVDGVRRHFSGRVVLGRDLLEI
jgi:ribonuclease BN (tRNA processing enzyme)